MNPLNLVCARSAKRHDAYHTKTVRKIFIPNDETRQYIKGQYSLTQVNGKLNDRERFIVVDRNTIDFGDWQETPTAAARDYIHALDFKPRRQRAGAIYRPYVQTPDFAIPGARFSDGEYIDIRAAYFSIAQLVGWDCNYVLGRWLMPGRTVSDFPFPDNRIARNSLITSAEKKTFMRRVVKGKIVERPAWNELTNLNLVTVVSDILQSLAILARDAGAVYANTDGYIAPNQNTADRIKQYILDFGLEGRTKHTGPGAIAGMNAYRIGEKQTIGFIEPRGQSSPRNAIDAIELDKVIWLQRNLEYLKSKEFKP